ncbi:hypothetical protein KIW84_057894 [Lathyrus oleraceus]|uniref:Mitochondrial import inner membrane translocase subunit n=1 Tax=Pisum sativum TaxID=3888 RepID=A0A9D4X5R7_PEA|nr:hypothetical protein KIW84_057894 [Pisum sativum]
MAANGVPPTALDKEQAGLSVKLETSFLFSRRYKESELNMGENSCIDRCVSKYWHVTNLVGQLLGTGKPQ